jgi:hypothetical protein
MRCRRTIVLGLVLVAVGCGSGSTEKDMAASFDMGLDMAVRRTADVALSFEPAGLWWDTTTQSLYLANDGGQQIVKWDEQGGRFDVFAKLPTILPSFGGLGQLVKTKDGSWYVTRFGATMNTPANQAASAVLRVAPDGTVSALPMLAPTRRRIGLTVDADGMTLYDGWYIGKAKTNLGSGISSTSMAGGETDLVMMTAIEKPVGVLALGGNIYFSDELGGVIYKFAIATPGTPSSFATITDGPDQLAAGPSGTIMVVTQAGTVYQVDSSGTPTQLKSGYRALRGVAYDADHKRLFFSEPDGAIADGGMPMPVLHIIPID